MVLRHTEAPRVNESEIELSEGEALVCRFAVPVHHSRIILRDTIAVGVPVPEMELRLGERRVYCGLFGALHETIGVFIHRYHRRSPEGVPSAAQRV